MDRWVRLTTTSWTLEVIPMLPESTASLGSLRITQYVKASLILDHSMKFNWVHIDRVVRLL